MADRYYLYGIFPAPGPSELEVEGLDKQQVRSHPLEGFTFLYSETGQERYLASRKNLLGHEKVLEEAMQHGHRTLLPLQFGLIIEGWEQVVQQLVEPHGSGLNRLFERLEGRREVSVKVLWDQAAELEMLMQENASLRQERDALEGKQLSMDQIISIGQDIEQAMNARKQGIITAFRAALNSLAVEAVENDPMMDSMIYNAAYLIDWEDEPSFSQAIEALDAQFEERLRIRYNNFTAPYNFAQLDRLD
ncbi:GvpL/GvpF family gas vesicle protein [Pseudanabaena sp. FACHB-2040]|uniref:gas vesicle protein GvpF n=1 Tax=Pseudanabaena sp. FACHB-2040 TaxID=2692859 RepID=UPI001683027B|nr:GvpL/GvpF family gas vesicle protein [Pseudanabaena sp. FACHB-2040]MBD2258550.1 GvpL/GvpF family gas vesicle protein [Pseudanabaena sp. FACHB-2040]